MKRAKKLYCLLGVLGVGCVATYALMQYEEYKEEIKNSNEVVLEIDPDTVKSLSWNVGDEQFTFRKDESWIYETDEAFPVDEEEIMELLENFRAFEVSFIIENVEDHSLYGLDEPMSTITITTDTDTFEIKLGDYSQMDEERYISVGENVVYLAAEDPYKDFEVELKDMIKHDDTYSFDTVNKITFSGNENYEILHNEESVESYCSEDVYFAQIGEESLPLDTSTVNRYLTTISDLNPTLYVTYNATEEELAEYGLDRPELTITVEHSKEEDETVVEDTFVLHVSKSAEEREKEAEEMKKAENGESEETDETEETEEETTISAYVRVGESQIVYEVSSYLYDKLMSAAYDDLRHYEVMTADFDTISQIDIHLEDRDYTITTAESEADEETVYLYQDEEIEISGLKQAIESMEAENFTDEAPTEKLEIAYTVHLNNEHHPKVDVELYRYDGEYCLAVIDGEPVSFVERHYVVDLIEAINEIML